MAGALALVRHAFADWRRDNAGRLGAALSYYRLFSIAPLLIVAIAIAGFLFGREAAQGQIVSQIQGLVGDAGARAVRDMIQNSRQPATGVWATVVGLATLLLGATGAFTELKSALNVVWDVKDADGGIAALLRPSASCSSASTSDAAASPPSTAPPAPWWCSSSGSTTPRRASSSARR